MNYTLIRSRRKTLALQLKTDGSLLVRCPLKMSLHEVEGFIQATKLDTFQTQMLRENTRSARPFVCKRVWDYATLARPTHYVFPKILRADLTPGVFFWVTSFLKKKCRLGS
jgi:hypothetical protein